MPQPNEALASERAMLAGLLAILDVDAARAGIVLERLEPAMLVEPIYREIFAAVAEAAGDSRPGVAAVAANIRRACAASGLDPADSITRLVELIEEFVPRDSATHAELAADEIRLAYGRRQAAGVLSQALERIGEPRSAAGDFAQVVEQLERLQVMVQPTGASSPAAGLTSILEGWADDVAEPCVPTGFAALDNRLGGGLSIGITGIAARPGAGKSALAVQLVLGALLADRSLRAVWFRGEMSNRLLASKMLACWTAVRGDAIGPATFRDCRMRSKSARAGAKDLADVVGDRLHVVDPPLTPAVMDSEVVRLGARLAVVDYLQLCESPGQQDRRGEIEDVTRRLAQLSVRHEVAVVVVASIAKATSEASGIGSLGKDSNLLDYACHSLISLWPAGDRGADPREVTLRIDKNRTGTAGEIPLFFTGGGQYFTPADPDDGGLVDAFAEFAAWGPGAGP